MQALDDGLGAQAVRRVGLGVKKYFGMQHVVDPGPRQIGTGHVEKVLFGLEYRSTRVVDVQKALQVVKHIGMSQCLYAGVGQRHTVALAHGKYQFGFQRAFDVHVQLGLGHGAQ